MRLFIYVFADEPGPEAQHEEVAIVADTIEDADRILHNQALRASKTRAFFGQKEPTYGYCTAWITGGPKNRKPSASTNIGLNLV